MLYPALSDYLQQMGVKVQDRVPSGSVRTGSGSQSGNYTVTMKRPLVNTGSKLFKQSEPVAVNLHISIRHSSAERSM